MTRRAWAVVALAALGAAGSLAAAEKAKPAALAGAYSREVGDNTVRFDFKPGGVLVVTITNGSGQAVEATAETGRTRDGAVVFGVVTDKKGESGPEVGTPFCFKVELKDGTLVVSDLRGPDTEHSRPVVEGEYKPAK